MKVTHPRFPRRRRTAAERSEIIERFRQSGLSQVAFSRQEGIALATLQSWLAKERSGAGLQRRATDPGLQQARTPVSSPMSFDEVAVSSLFSAADWAVELKSPTGLVIRCRQALRIEDLERLLRGAGC